MDHYLESDSEFPLFIISVRHAAIVLALDAGVWEGADFTEEDISPFTENDHWIAPHEIGNVEPVGRVKKFRDEIEATICASIDAGRLKAKDVRRELSGKLKPAATWLNVSAAMNWAVEHGFEVGDLFREYVENEETLASETLEFLDRRRMAISDRKTHAELDARRDALKPGEVLEILQENHRLRQQTKSTAVEPPVLQRERASYLNLIGGLLELMLGKTATGKAHSVFDSQSAIIAALEGHFPNRPGMKARTLEGKFAMARRIVRVS